jgi:hypothetical protein
MWNPVLGGGVMRVDDGDDQGRVLTAEVVSYDDAPSECTIYPEGVSKAERTTTWITARGDAFCSLQSRE